ncbi:hypothetical protein L2E82_50934 [Cichorium intybus]|nr:hypothetical protein L2E82_50934 [Cichorium intybus]
MTNSSPCNLHLPHPPFSYGLGFFYKVDCNSIYKNARVSSSKNNPNEILLCDNDTKSSEEVFNLLCKCSYQVTSVRSPRQVIDALNAEGPDIDIILSEIDLPMPKGMKM